MKLLIYTPVFYPSIGGIETINSILAHGFSLNKFEVIVITPTPNPYNNDSLYDFKIIRDTSFKTLWKYYKWSDIYLQSVLSLKGVWPLLFKRKKWVIIHHTCSFYSWDQSPTIISYLKHFITRFASNIVVSDAVGRNLRLSNYKIIWNAYNNQIFKCINIERRRNFIFVGRLVTEKGINLLIDAYYNYLKSSKNRWTLTIIGDGPEKDKLSEQVSQYNLNDFIEFRGRRMGEDLVYELNMHHTLIIPSVCKEAFGIVALEGIACGCLCLVSDGDGLQEATDKNAILFKKGSVIDLTNKMLCAETSIFKPKNYLKEIDMHLSKYTPEYMTTKYINHIQSL